MKFIEERIGRICGELEKLRVRNWEQVERLVYKKAVFSIQKNRRRLPRHGNLVSSRCGNTQ